MAMRWLGLAALAMSGACSLAPESGALGELGAAPATDRRLSDDPVRPTAAIDP